MSKPQLLLATNNPGKRREFQTLFADLPYQLLLPSDIGLSLDVAETGETYLANAQLKALAFAQAANLLALGDDSGLEVAALNGAPGVYSARYAGPSASDADRRRKMLAELQAVPSPRLAQFVCIIVIATPAGEQVAFEGVCPGEIIGEERGTNGFGYDPIFYLTPQGRTMAELTEAEKHLFSHRGRAAVQAAAWLREQLQRGEP